LEASIRSKTALTHEAVDVRVWIHHVAIRLDRHHGARNTVVGKGCAEEGLQGAPGGSREKPEKSWLTTKQTPQDDGDRERILPVNDGSEHLPVQPLSKQERALLMAARTETVRLATECEEILVRARVTTDAGEPVMEVAAGEKASQDVRDPRPPRPILTFEPRLVDARIRLGVVLDQAEQG
jgi:hypothetical protein